MGAPVIEWIAEGIGFAPDAARSFRRLTARFGRRPGCNSSYRDWGKQLGMYYAWNAYVNGTGPYPGHSRAIHPDYSMHCKGLALDTNDWSTPGFLALAAEYGWIQTMPDDRTERHHLEYQSWRDQHRNEAAPSGEEEDMTPDQDARLRNIEALLAGTGSSLQDPAWSAGQGSVLNHLQNLTGFIWGGGTSAADPEFLGGPGTIYNIVKTPVQRTVDGQTSAVPQIQDNADTNTFVRQLLARPAAAVSAEQVKAIADAVVAAIGKPTVTIDYAAIAKAVNDDSAKRLAA